MFRTFIEDEKFPGLASAVRMQHCMRALSNDPVIPDLETFAANSKNDGSGGIMGQGGEEREPTRGQEQLHHHTTSSSLRRPSFSEFSSDAVVALSRGGGGVSMAGSPRGRRNGNGSRLSGPFSARDSCEEAPQKVLLVIVYRSFLEQYTRLCLANCFVVVVVSLVCRTLMRRSEGRAGEWGERGGGFCTFLR